MIFYLGRPHLLMKDFDNSVGIPHGVTFDSWQIVLSIQDQDLISFYLYYPNHHPQQSIEYYKKSCEIIGLDKTYLIFSDDLEGVKDMFEFLPNKIFYTSGEDWLDMYTMSLCKYNIICNSTFSWWAAYLNINEDKKIITTTNWFGSAYKDWDISTLFPNKWLKL